MSGQSATDSPVPAHIREKVQKRLHEIEQEHSVQVLFAVESGSRAWGFESQDSDYDVRFIYRHPPAWYIHVLPPRDVIEIPIVDEMDFSGWDIKKTLFLLNKSNPVLFEWFQSPLVYFMRPGFIETMRAVAIGYFSPVGSIYHYLHMAENNYREYLRQDVVKVKKYFYVLRPLFACMWVESFQSAPPMEFDRLRQAVLSDEKLNRIIDGLLKRKRSGVELGREPKILEINDFVEKALGHFREVSGQVDPQKKPDPQMLDVLLRVLVAGTRENDLSTFFPD